MANLFIIDRLWQAGLLLKNGRKYTAVYYVHHIHNKYTQLSHACIEGND